MTDSQIIDKLRSDLRIVRVQRNNYEQLLIAAENKLREFHTPALLNAYGHHFRRYLFDNEFAEEMKCSKCGYTISACKDEDEVLESMLSISGKQINCIK